MRKVLRDKDYKVNGEAVTANMQVGVPRKPMVKAQAMFLKASKGEKKKILAIIGFSFAEVELEGNRERAARYVIEHGGHTEAGWTLFPDVLHNIYVNIQEVMFRAFSNESRLGYSRFQRRTLCDGVQLVTTIINRESSENVDLNVSRLSRLEFVRTDLPVILVLQETRTWVTNEVHVQGLRSMR